MIEREAIKCGVLPHHIAFRYTHNQLIQRVSNDALYGLVKGLGDSDPEKQIKKVLTVGKEDLSARLAEFKSVEKLRPKK